MQISSRCISQGPSQHFPQLALEKHLFRQGTNFQTDGDLSESSCYLRIQEKSYNYCHKAAKKESIHPCWLFFPQKTLSYHKRNRDKKGKMEPNIHSEKNITCDPQGNLSTAIFLTLIITTALSATVGNILICMAVYKTKTLRTPANYLLVSLSVASLLFVPVLGGYSFSLTIKECDPRAKTLCTWSSKMDWILFCVVMLHLMFISLDRLLAIKLPMRYVVKPVSWTSFKLEFINTLNCVVLFSI